jgi:hypothetical protein
MAGTAIYMTFLSNRHLEVSQTRELSTSRLLLTVLQRVWNVSQHRLLILGNLVLLRSTLPPLLLLPINRTHPNTPLPMGVAFYDPNIDCLLGYIHSSNLFRLHVSPSQHYVPKIVTKANNTCLKQSN